MVGQILTFKPPGDLGRVGNRAYANPVWQLSRVLMAGRDSTAKIFGKLACEVVDSEARCGGGGAVTMTK